MTNNNLIASAPLAVIVDRLRSGEMNLIDYIEQTCDRVESVDSQIHALLPEPDRRTRLRNEAQQLSRRYANPDERPPIYGVLIGVKDIFRADGFPTQAGSALPTALFEAAEAACVRRLKEAGALVLGKTVTTEFAYFEPGPTRNPHNLEHTPGGSSSGSAAAVAAGLTPLTLGTQTIASVTRPAAFCGVVGFKPSYGRIDPTGVIFISPSLDHVGMFTQDAVGMKLAASVLLNDWRTVKMKPQPTLGVPEGAYLQQTSAEAMTAYDRQIARLERAGYTVKRVPVLENIEALSEQHRDLMAAEMAQQHVDWFARYESLYRPRTATMIRNGQQIDASRIGTVQKEQQKTRQKLAQIMADAEIDLFIAPSAKGTAPEGISMTGDPAMSYPWTFTGMPCISLPAGQGENGLPLGMQCIGTFGGDEMLLGWAPAIADILMATR